MKFNKGQVIKKLIYSVIAILLGYFSFKSLIGWITNIAFSYTKWELVIFKSDVLFKICESIQNVELFERYYSSYPILSQDLSSITTFIFFFTMLCATVRVIKIIFNKTVIPAKDFPWSGYKIVYVQLGLLGTIFGLIIAFNNVDFKTSINPERILNALATALWSTFMAVILAYIVIPLVFHRIVFGLILKSYIPDDLPKQIKIINQALINLLNNMKKTNKQFQLVNDNINNMTDTFSDKNFKNFNNNMNNMTNSFSSTTKHMESLNTELSNAKEISKIIRTADLINSKIEDLNNEINDLKEILNSKTDMKLLEDELSKFKGNINNEINKKFKKVEKSKDLLHMIKQLLRTGK